MDFIDAFIQCDALHTSIVHFLQLCMHRWPITRREKMEFHAQILRYRVEISRKLTEAGDRVTDLRRRKEVAAMAGVQYEGATPPDDWVTTLVRYRESLEQLNDFECELRYELAGKELIVLPEPRDYNCRVSTTFRNHVVARLCWLRARLASGDNLFPVLGRERYAEGSLPLVVPGQMLFLDPAQHWMVDMTAARLNIPLTAEWDSIFELVGFHVSYACLARFRDLLAVGGIMRRDGMKRVDEFTTPTNAEAIAAGYEDCLICGSSFSDDMKMNEGVREDAVRTICGHYIGRDYLQGWVNSFVANPEVSKDDITCPLCRTSLILGQFPVSVQPAIKELLTFFRNDPGLDEEIDQLLLDAEEADLLGCYGTELSIMLIKLDKRRNEVLDLCERVMSRIEEVTGLPREELVGSVAL